jgi:hypothetical protein
MDYSDNNKHNNKIYLTFYGKCTFIDYSDNNKHNNKIYLTF